MSAPPLGLTFIPAPGSPWRVVDAPVVDGVDGSDRLVFLEPARNQPARKAHKLIQRGDGSSELLTEGYGKAWEFRYCSEPVADVDDLFAALQKHAPLNQFAVRGQLRSGAGSTINRRLAGDDADILDVASRVIPVDLDCEVAPDGIDTSDIMTVGDYLRGRLPDELRDVSCVIQLSAGYGLGKWKIGPVILKARLWFLNDAALDGPALRRWFKAANASGNCAVMDGAVATANQPIYTAAPLFSGMIDPVPVRLALLYGDQDVASIRPPAAPDPVVYAPGAIGERCPDRLKALVLAIQRTAESGLPRHPVINNAAFTAGRMVAGGAFTRDEAVKMLMPAALATESSGAERAIHDGLTAGMNCGSPILVGARVADDEADAPGADDGLLSAADASAALDSALAKFFEDAKTGRSRLGIAGAAGLGKTTRALALAQASGLTVDHYVPSHKVAQEQAARLPQGAAIAIRGRTHADGDRSPLCAKYEAAEALQAAGMGNHHQVLLCGKFNHTEGRFPCPYSRGCGYHAQFNSTAPIRFYPHEWLTLDKVDRGGKRAADVAIIDENFAGAFEKGKRWTLESLAEAGGVFFDIGDAVRNGTLTQETHGAAIVAALETAPTFTAGPGIHPEMTAQEAAQAIRRWAALPRVKSLPWDLLRAAAGALATGETKRLYAGELNGKTTVYFDGLKELTASAKSWLFLDAGLIPEQVNSVIPDTTVLSIQARRNAKVIQITDSALSLTRLKADNDHLMSRIAEFVERLKANGGRGAVIGPKDFMQAAIAAGHFAGCATGHFGALRGVNALEGADWLVQVGRNEPPVWAVERKARSWYGGNPDLELGTVNRKIGWLPHPDGGKVEAGAVTQFADARCQSILESLREQESLQAIDRLRLVHAAKPKTVYLLSNLPLPGIRPDVLTTLDKLLLPGRLATVMLRDKAISGAAMLAKRHPDLFENPKQASNDLATLQPLDSLYRLLIGDLGVEGIATPIRLVAQNYRTATQRGGRPRRALLYENTAAAPLLDGLHPGETVELRDRYEPEPPIVEPVIVDPVIVSAVETMPVDPPIPIPIQPIPLVTAPTATFTMWRAVFSDNHTATIREPEPVTLGDILRYAAGLTGIARIDTMAGCAA